MLQSVSELTFLKMISHGHASAQNLQWILRLVDKVIGLNLAFNTTVQWMDKDDCLLSLYSEHLHYFTGGGTLNPPKSMIQTKAS